MTGSPPAVTESEEYLYVLRLTRPKLLQDGPTPYEADVLSRHEAYVGGLAEDRILLLAGRTLTEDSFGLVLFRASSPEVAESIMRDDPSVADGVMRAELHPFRVAFPAADPR